MIICFYPGGCGNRYYLSLQNKEYKKHLVSYDGRVNQPFRKRYLLDNGIDSSTDNEVLLTHCLNFEKIKFHFPNHTTIVALDTDFKMSLRRQWMLDGLRNFQSTKTPSGEPDDSVFDEISSAFESIKYHKQYYNHF